MSNSEKNQIEAALEAGNLAAQIALRVTNLTHPEIPEIEIPICLSAEGEALVFKDALAEFDRRADGPRRRTGVQRFSEVDSLIDYVKRFANPAEAIVYANTADLSFVVVFDEHPPGNDVGDASWREHRASYACPRSPEWLAWSGFDGAQMTQAKFADFIESRLEDIATAEGFPRASDVLTMARNLMIRTKGTFQREFNPTNGDSVLVNKTETDTGSTPIPRAFLLGIPVFEGGARYSVEARVRFGVSDGGAAFSFTMHRRKEIERDAFAEVRAKIAAATGVVVLAGTA